MSTQFPSIQSFFERKSPPQKNKRFGIDLQADAGDGFDDEEMHVALHPTLQNWRPRVEYEDVDISSLISGPKCVNIMGRVVNLYQQVTPSKKPQAARGCWKVMVKDDTGALMVCAVSLSLPRICSPLCGLTNVHPPRLGYGTPKWITISISANLCLSGPHTSLIASLAR